MNTKTFYPSLAEDAKTDSSTWSSAGTIFTSKSNLIRIVWNDNHFSSIPTNANIDSIVISFSATNNTTSAAQPINIYLQNSDLRPKNSLVSTDLLGTFDASFANTSKVKQTITKTLYSGSKELDKFETWMRTNPMYMILHASENYSPEMTYEDFSVNISYRMTTPYVYNGTKWVEATPYVYNGTKWVKASAYIHNGSTWV